MKRILVFSLLLLFTAISGMQEVASQKVTQNKAGMHDGFYYSFWNDGSSGTAFITLKPDGSYETGWTNIGNFTAGKGWSVGKEDREICYSGKFDGGSNGFLAVYGWTRDSLVEYYVVENYGKWTPPGGASLGSFESDGGTYNIYRTLRVNQPSIIGTATFYQYWSVRTSKRTEGTITFANHTAAWKNKGLYLGKVWGYQIMETEGYKSTGYSDITVRECNSGLPN